MQRNIINQGISTKLLMYWATVFIMTSCNKNLPPALPIMYPPINNSNITIGDLLGTDTGYSFFAAAAQKSGQLSLLSENNSEFTVFLPNNDAFRASGIPSVETVKSLPVQTLAGIVSYSIIPGKQFTSAEISTSFPNEQLPTSVTLGLLPGTSIPFRLSTFPSTTITGFYDNNIPVVKPDIKMKNGVIHLVARIVVPPSQLLKNAIYSNPELKYFKAAVERADSGQSALNRIDSILGYGLMNMTVLAPSNAAFQTFLFGIAYSYLLQQGYDQATAGQMAGELSSSTDIFRNPTLFSTLPASVIRGILLYHFLATPDPNTGSYEPNIRVFSNNFSSTPTFYKTLINSAVTSHPGILAQATFSNLFVTNLNFKGFGTFPPGGTAYSGNPAKVISMDNHAVNGIFYIIDRVLLPQ